MKTAFKRALAKDLKKLPAEIRQQVESFLFDEAATAPDLTQLGPIKPLTGHRRYFRKRFGDYWLGFKVGGDTVFS